MARVIDDYTFECDQVVEWRSVPGYTGLYEVSSTGLIRSLPRTTTKGRILKGSTAKGSRYYMVSLSKNGTQETVRIHKIVAETFIGPCPDGLEIRHLDGDHTNNNASNLKYGTRQENAHDTIAHGRWGRGQLKKTHCPHGHLYDEENTRLRNNGSSRSCKECNRQWSREYKIKRKLNG